jgi:hypothetical protein
MTLATALVVSFATSASATNYATSKATVMLFGMSPVSVTGSGFLPRERVRVRVFAGAASFARAPRANAKGRFAVQFPKATLPDCADSVFVIATGNRSGRSAMSRIRSIRIPPPCGIFPQP